MRVLGLMILGHVGRRHENDRLADQAELRDGACPGTGDDDVGRRIGQVHPFDEGPSPDAARIAAAHELVHLPFVILPGLPDNLKPTLAHDLIRMGLHRLVQRPGTEASPDDQHDRLAGLQPEMRPVPRLSARRRPPEAAKRPRSGLPVSTIRSAGKKRSMPS